VFQTWKAMALSLHTIQDYVYCLQWWMNVRCSLEHKSCGLSRLLNIEGRCHVSSKFLFIFFSFEIPCNELLIYILVINFQYDSYTPCIVSMFLVMLWSSMLSFVWVIVLVTKSSYIHHQS
jgi:hypothetical protein